MKYCEFCGAQLKDTDKFCTRCGKKQIGTNEDSPIESPVENNDPIPSPEPESGKYKYWTIGIVVLFIICGFIGYSYYRHKAEMNDSIEEVRRDSIAYVDSINKLRQDSIEKVLKDSVALVKKRTITYDLIKKYMIEGEIGNGNVSLSKIEDFIKAMKLDVIYKKKYLVDSEYDYTDKNAYLDVIGGTDIKMVKDADGGVTEIKPTSSQSHGFWFVGGNWSEDARNATDFHFEKAVIIFLDKGEKEKFDKQAKNDGCRINSSGHLAYNVCQIWFEYSYVNGKYIYEINREH